LAMDTSLLGLDGVAHCRSRHGHANIRPDVSLIVAVVNFAVPSKAVSDMTVLPSRSLPSERCGGWSLGGSVWPVFTG
jgi:hypothetical protein